LTTSGLIANNLPAVCGAVADTCTRTVQRREKLLPHKNAITASWRREIKLIPSITAAADMQKSSYRRVNHREDPKLRWEGFLLKSYHPRCLLRCGAPRQHTAATMTSNTQSSSGKFIRSKETKVPAAE
jgi:hypothetical protein